MRFTTLASAAALLLTLRSAAAAQSIPSPYRFIETRQEAGAFAGWVEAGTGQFGYGPGSGLQLGVRYAIDLSGPFSVEGVAHWLSTTRDLVDPRRVEGQRVIGETDVALVGLDARVKLSLTGQRTWHGLSPFLLAGVGLARDVAADAPEEEDFEEADRFELGTLLIGSLGGGTRWFPSDRWMIRVDALLDLWKLDTPTGFRDPARGFEDIGEGEWVNGTALSLGAAYRF